MNPLLLHLYIYSYRMCRSVSIFCVTWTRMEKMTGETLKILQNKSKDDKKKLQHCKKKFQYNVVKKTVLHQLRPTSVPIEMIIQAALLSYQIFVQPM